MCRGYMQCVHSTDGRPAGLRKSCAANRAQVLRALRGSKVCLKELPLLQLVIQDRLRQEFQVKVCARKENPVRITEDRQRQFRSAAPARSCLDEYHGIE